MNQQRHKYKLTDLIDMERLMPLLHAMHQATQEVCLALMDRDNNMLAAIGFKSICSEFHRKHPNTEAKCVDSNRIINEKLFDSPFVQYECPNGIIDVAFPIVIEGCYVGTFWTGQVLVKEPDLDFFKAQAEACGFDQEAYLEALRQVPVLSQEHLNKMIEAYRLLADFIVQLGLKNLKLHQINQEMQAQVDIANRQQELIIMQQESLRELSTPIMEIWDKVLVLPVVGILDTQRSLDLMTNLLDAIVKYSARCAIIDVTGVSVIDTKTADYLLKVARAAGLLGTRCVLTGLSPAVAQTLVEINADLSSQTTLRNLKEGLRNCISWLNDK